MKIKTRQEFRKKFSTLYQWLLRNNPTLLDKYFPNKRTYWTLESCRASALNYSFRNAWQKNDYNAYSAAHHNGWLEECCAHMKTPYKTWTLESCKASAFNYDTRKAWQKGDGLAYSAAQNKSWLEECCAHMRDLRKIYTLKFCKASAANYSTRASWAKGDASAYQAAFRNGWLEECCSHMKYSKYAPKKSNSIP